ncbi:MAG TPA: calycin-like domain-containing protein [Candidatus Cryptobacteroides merdipullorum]|uniref:Calycin-like domain-containing protein n=1 Tax=Candidatus Cryptobacteroides merdipullorum TaxID=2840771 RepID=A0A9D1KJG7_9BACT|nr:calycin-like domain-containing protein [Candidatus Cryptobacteroides merdipullorum]
MKKTIFALMAITVLGLAACQKTETPDSEPTAAETASGTYTGTMEIALNDGAPFELPDQTITITAAGESSIDLTIADFALGEFTLGTISMTGCSLMENATDGSITTESEQTITVGEIGDCAIKLEGTFKDNSTTLDLQISPSILTINVSVHFDGVRAETDAE